MLVILHEQKVLIPQKRTPLGLLPSGQRYLSPLSSNRVCRLTMWVVIANEVRSDYQSLNTNKEQQKGVPPNW